MDRFIDVLLPPVCPGCGTEGAAPCAVCAPTIARRVHEPAGTPLGLVAVAPVGLVQIEWCAAFTGPTRACLHALKYDGERRLARPLGELMADRWRAAGIGGELLVPVPIHDARRRDRGFNQAELLARVIGRSLDLPVLPALTRQARTTAQHGLDRGTRAGNVGHAFVADALLEARVRGRWLVLVDDVVTTGATLSACAAALRAAGARAVSALTLARER